MSDKYWQCPNDESHAITFKGLPLSARVPYCAECFGRVSAVFQGKPAEAEKEEEMPRRIQRKRTKGWRMPPNTVYVGRPTIFGNPYRVGRPLGVPFNCETREEAVALFREHVKNAIRNGWDIKWKLRGKDLACWCPLNQPCHADVLLEIANHQPTPVHHQGEK